MNKSYNDAFDSEEGVRLRGAIHDAIDAYVRYFESRGVQIHQSWVTWAQRAASFPNPVQDSK